jgi:hypothetical protein
MTWASVGRAGSTGNATANTTGMAITINGVVGSGAAIGDVLICAIAVDNASSVNNADNVDVTAVTDTGSNQWTKVRERTVGGAAAQAGATCSLWYSRITSALSSAAVVSASFANGATSDAKAGIVWRFTASPTASIRAVDSTYVVIATSSNGVLDLAAPTPTGHLRVRAVAAETTVTAFTTTAGWTTIGTTRASATAAMAVFGEFLITSNSTAASNCSISAAADNASVYALFEENELTGDGIF